MLLFHVMYFGIGTFSFCSYATRIFTSALVRKGQISVCNICPILKPAIYKYHIIIIIIITTTWQGHDMEMLSTLLSLCEGNLVDSPQRVPILQTFNIFFVVSLNKVLIKHLSCHGAHLIWNHFTVIMVMKPHWWQQAITWSNVDTDIHHLLLADHNELTHWPLGDLDVIFKNLIFNLILLIGILRSLYDNALQWMRQNITDDKSTLVQVMAWCRQATSHYLSQCWLRSLSPYGITRPQWVNIALFA